MKKLILLILLLFFLSGCTITEDTKEFRDLSKQFDQLVIQDLHTKDGFDQFFNDITKNLISANIKLHVMIYSEFGFLVENRYGTAMIYENSDGYYHALTTSFILSISNTQTFSIDIYDYLGNKYVAQGIKINPNHQLVSFKFVQTTVILNTLPITAYTPVLNEPIFMMGNPNHTQNTILFGSYLGLNDDLRMLSNIKTDAFANGSAVLNVAKQCIGIQIGFTANTLIFLSANEILEFLLWIETNGQT
jgi:hypothetical protein